MKGFTRLIFRFLPTPILRIIRNRRYIKCRIEAALFPRKIAWYCPCCGMRFNAFVEASFLNLGKFNLSRYEHTKQDVLCPVCKSLPRHRILASWCEKHRGLLDSSSILYFAPEYSMTLWMKRNGLKCTTADLYKASSDLILDMQATGLPDESYDVIIANHVLEHVDDFRLALKEVRRILKSSGLFICSFPMDPKIELLDEDSSVQTDEERRLRFGQNDHKRVFGMKSNELLVEAGFKVEVIDGSNYPYEILPVVGPADYDMNRLFCCRKDMNG
jgi:SAM-dependent methyltransferase